MSDSIKVKSLITACRHIGGVEIELHPFLSPPLDGGKRPPSCPSHFTPGEEPWYLWNRKLGRSLSWCGSFGEKFLASARFLAPSPPATKLFSILSTQSRPQFMIITVPEQILRSSA